LVLTALAVLIAAGAGGGVARAADAQHGISVAKGCVSPTQIGEPYTCIYSIRNQIDDPQDTLTIHSFVDTVHAAGGDVSSGNVFSSLRLVIGQFAPGFSTPPTCEGPAGFSGDGSAGNPWVGASKCTLPFGSRIGVLPFSFYTVKASDFNLPDHALGDAVAVGWHDLCNGLAFPDPPNPGGNTPGAGNCNPDPPVSGAASQTIVTQVPSTTATTIHNAAHAPVTVVAAGSIVHDSVTVSGGAADPVPTGTVTIDWFTNNTCTGAPVTTSAAQTLVNGTVDATAFPQGPLAVGLYGFKAHYLGNPANPVYSPSDGPCEPLQVVDANIQITPATANNPVGAPHVFTAHVNVNTGTGFENAPAGTSISFTIASGPGSFTTTNPCTTVGTTGSCTITLSSTTTGTTVVSATTTVSVLGVSLTRTTDGTGANSASAQKNWADAAVRTDVHNGNHDVVTSVSSGTSVHDKVFVTKLAGTPAAVPAPAGNVTFHRYSTIDCTGAFVDETVALAADGTAETSSFTATANMSYKADYAGNANYPARSGACEPLSVTSGGGGGGSPGTPAIAITKNPKEQTVQSGGTATWTIVVTNTGQVTLTNVRVTDPLAPDCNRTSAQIPALASMAPGASLSYTCSLANVTASFTNVATDTGTPPTGPDVSATDTAHVTVPAPPPVLTPHISVTKLPKDQSFVAPGGSNVTWTIRVTNDGQVTLTDVVLADAKAPECNRTKADIPALASMAVGASVTYKCTKFVTPAFKSPNVVVATGKPPTGPSVTDSDTARVHAALTPTNPRITIAKCPAEGPANCIKSVNGVPKDTQSVLSGGTAEFRVTVRNTGDVTLTNVTVTDLLAPGCDRDLGSMAARTSKSFLCTDPTITGPLNTAAVVGTASGGAKVRDSDTSSIITALAPPPKIAIAKCPIDTDNPCIKRAPGDPKDQQTLKVNRSGSTNEVLEAGTAEFRITVTNTGAETLHNVKVTDPLSPGCNRSLGTMAPGKSKTYTCQRANVSAPYLNTSKVVGTSPSGTKVNDQDVSEVIVKPYFTG